MQDADHEGARGSGERNGSVSGLRYGTYYLKELQAPEGYQRSNEDEQDRVR